MGWHLVKHGGILVGRAMPMSMPAVRHRPEPQPSPWGRKEEPSGQPPQGPRSSFPKGTSWARSFPSQLQCVGLQVPAVGTLVPQEGVLCWQRRIYFRIRSRKLQLYLLVPDDVEDMKAGRVVVSSLGEQSSSIWYYEDGLIKNQVRARL